MTRDAAGGRRACTSGRGRSGARRTWPLRLVLPAACWFFAYLLLAAIGPSIAPFSPTDFNTGAPAQGSDPDPSVRHRRIRARRVQPRTGRRRYDTAAVGRRDRSWRRRGLRLGLDLRLSRRDRRRSARCALVDVALALPGLLLALLILTSLGPSSLNLVVAIAIVFVPKSARIARSAVLPLRDLGYVEAARLRGARWPDDRVPGAPAQRSARADRGVLPALRVCAAADLVARLPRVRRATAHPGLGTHDQRRRATT